MRVSVASQHGLVPRRVFEDNDREWAKLLANPLPGTKEGECVRGAEFPEEATAPTKMWVQRMWGALLDIDEGNVPTFYDIAQRFPFRFIGWTTYNHSPTGGTPGGFPAGAFPPEAVDSPAAWQRFFQSGGLLPQALPALRGPGMRLRVFVPFEESVWPNEYAYVFRRLNEFLGVDSGAQHNTDRLGYTARLKPEALQASQRAYRWWIHQAPRINPRKAFGILRARDDQGVETWVFPEQELSAQEFSGYENVDTVEEPDKSNWRDDQWAFEEAQRYFSNAGYGVEAGSRHHELFKIGCKLWWDFWLPFDKVVEVLQIVNGRFSPPKSIFEVVREAEASFHRTRGSSKVRQEEEDGTPKAPGFRRLKPPDISWADIEDLSQKACKSNDIQVKRIGRWLKNIIPQKGTGRVNSIDSVAERDVALRRTAIFLGEKFPSHEAETIAAKFAESITVSSGQAPWDMNLAKVKRIVEKAQQNKKQQQQDAKEAEDKALKARILEATNRERASVYTEEEIQKWADLHNARRAEWQSRWVIVLGKNHYIFVNGRYKEPIDADGFVNRAVVDLSPVPGVQLHEVDKNGNQRIIPKQQIISRYGTVARRGIIDLTAQRGYYDIKTETFVEAPCIIREELEPCYSSLVDGWLNSFPDPFEVKHYLSWVPDCSEPLAALYLKGQRNSGKTLFAVALNKLWSEFGVLPKMDSYFDSFNESIMNSPLLVADEYLPARLRKADGHEVFRNLTQSRSNPLRRKYVKEMSITGYFRVILLSNNEHMLPKGSGVVSELDSEASKERILYIDLEKGPANYLEGLTLKQRRQIIDEDLMAKHVLWLQQNRPERSENRFAVQGNDNNVVRTTSFEGLRGTLIHWVYNVVMEELGSDAGIRVNLEQDVPVAISAEGEVHVCFRANTILKRWKDHLGPDERTPTMHDITQALNTVRIGQVKRIRVNGLQGRYHPIDSRILMDFADWAGVESPLDKLRQLGEKALRENKERRLEYDDLEQEAVIH